jgi:hypothetical protein
VPLKNARSGEKEGGETEKCICVWGRAVGGETGKEEDETGIVRRKDISRTQDATAATSQRPTRVLGTLTNPMAKYLGSFWE